jgi:hypothetical protein
LQLLADASGQRLLFKRLTSVLWYMVEKAFSLLLAIDPRLHISFYYIEVAATMFSHSA